MVLSSTVSNKIKGYLRKKRFFESGENWQILLQGAKYLYFKWRNFGWNRQKTIQIYPMIIIYIRGFWSCSTMLSFSFTFFYTKFCKICGRYLPRAIYIYIKCRENNKSAIASSMAWNLIEVMLEEFGTS